MSLNRELRDPDVPRHTTRRTHCLIVVTAWWLVARFFRISYIIFISFDALVLRALSRPIVPALHIKQLFFFVVSVITSFVASSHAPWKWSFRQPLLFCLPPLNQLTSPLHLQFLAIEASCYVQSFVFSMFYFWFLLSFSWVTFLRLIVFITSFTFRVSYLLALDFLGLLWVVLGLFGDL